MTNFSYLPQTRMRRQRLALGFTQKYLAALARVNPSDLCRWENCRSVPYPIQAERLAQALGLRPEELQEAVEFVSKDPPAETTKGERMRSTPEEARINEEARRG